MYAKLETEKQDLNAQYKKLLGKKKQYKVVLFLCLLVISCAIGLFAFNRNLQSKDSKIQSLESDILEKNDTISNQRSNIAQLYVAQQKLNTEISDLQTTINKKNNIIQNKDVEIQNLASNKRNLQLENNQYRNENSNLQSQNNQYRSENSNLQSKNRILQSDVERCKNNDKNKKRPSKFYVEKVDCDDYSFKLTLYYDDGTIKSSGWCYRNKSYTLD